jgi:hypothetical protein
VALPNSNRDNAEVLYKKGTVIATRVGVTVLFCITMKHIFALLLCVAAVNAAAQDNWYVPSEVGTKFRYAVYDQSGQIINYMVTKVDSVYCDSKGAWVVRQSSTIYNSRNQPTGSVLYAESIISNDTTYLAVNRVMTISGAKVHTWGTLIALPSEIDELTRFAPRQLQCSISFAGMRFNTVTSIEDITLVNQEDLFVDNRIYDALKFSYNTTTKVLGRNENTFVTTWVAKEVGIMIAVVENVQNGNSTTTKLISVE